MSINKNDSISNRQSVELENFLQKTDRAWKMDKGSLTNPGVLNKRQTEQDYEGHRAHTAHNQNNRRHSHPHHKVGDRMSENDQSLTPLTHRVQSILGEDMDGGIESHPLFSEMEELVKDGNESVWKETARWVKFEEDVEEGGDRWSKPFVASLSLHSLFELRNLLTNQTVILDMEANSLEEIADLVCDNMVNAGSLPFASREKIRQILLLQHHHQHQRKNRNKENNMNHLPIIRSLSKSGRKPPTSKSQYSTVSRPATSSYSSNLADTTVDNDNISSPQNAQMNDSRGLYSAVPTTGDDVIKTAHKVNTQFMKKIAPGAEASNILVGEVECLNKTISAFIRLNQASIMGGLTEVPIPTRFMFILLGPVGSQGSFREIGRAMATLMSDEIFHEIAYRAKRRDHLLAGVDEFLDAVTVLPPGEWDPTIRIEPPSAIPSQEMRKRLPEKQNSKEINEEEDDQRLREESGLVRTGIWFGGLKNDLRRKVPWYWSDFKDAFSTQCIASWIFLYFACLSPIITFGGLLGATTGNNMAAMESLVSGFICGIIYGFFSGQPLTILASTGPVLVFESIVYQFCLMNSLEYMSFRFWIGTWISIILLFMVAIDASALVCYITRFTEENFATLVAIIFIYEAIGNVLAIGSKFPIAESLDCVCMQSLDNDDLNWTKYTRSECMAFNGTLIGTDCDKPEPVSNVFLMSIVLFFGTFTISIILKEFKNALIFPSKVRQLVSDFAVFIAILSMSYMDNYLSIPTPKLVVPAEFKPTNETRGWLIDPFLNPYWWWIIAFFPALLGVILIFMDQQITAVIVNRKEYKLKKGCGYHLDLFILSILIQICTTFGLPWFVAATVMSINHVHSLKLETECAAPGEKPQFLGVREQRVTHIMIFLTIGCSVFLTPLLSHIPMPVLFGVFLYMGTSSLKGLQLFDRMLIMFMPIKYQPDYMFLRQVPLKRVHVFTMIQLACLVILWMVKSYFHTSILFPLMLVVMIGIRKSLDCIFTQRELKILDDIMPEMTKPTAEKDTQNLEDGEQDQPPPYPGIEMENAKLSLIIPSKPINITDEINKTINWSNNQLSPTGEPRFATMAKEEKYSEQTRNGTHSQV